jgi:hypothetical protein
LTHVLAIVRLVLVDLTLVAHELSELTLGSPEQSRREGTLQNASELIDGRSVGGSLLENGREGRRLDALLLLLLLLVQRDVAHDGREDVSRDAVLHQDADGVLHSHRAGFFGLQLEKRKLGLGLGRDGRQVAQRTELALTLETLLVEEPLRRPLEPGRLGPRGTTSISTRREGKHFCPSTERNLTPHTPITG